MLRQENDSVATRPKLSDVFVVVLDVLCLGAGNEEFLLDLQGLLLHHCAGREIIEDILSEILA